MVVASQTWELSLPGCSSLKEKRTVVRSLKDRLSHKFNVSVAEVDAQNLWQRCVIGIAYVSNETVMINKVFEKIRTLVLSYHSVELIDSTMELL